MSSTEASPAILELGFQCLALFKTLICEIEDQKSHGRESIFNSRLQSVKASNDSPWCTLLHLETYVPHL